jgi:transcriptional regulator with XRE-family HTH domain
MAGRTKGAPGLVEQIRIAIRESGRSLNQLSKDCGVGRDRLSRFVRGERGMGLDALERLCQTLGLRIVGSEHPPAKGKGRKPKTT